MAILYARFPLEGVNRHFDIWLEEPLKDETERRLVHEHVLAFLAFYKQRLDYLEQFDAAGAVADGLRQLACAKA